MHIISWNVAGLKPLMERIHRAYLPADDIHRTSMSTEGGTAKKRRKLPPSAALYNFLQRHQADIFCLQEHKIPREQLLSRTEPRGCSTVDGYESFWSCCVNKEKRGFNGVVTYARKGTVQSADMAPLGSEDLDGQGRCIMTDHGTFVLFNVYVPASGGQPLSYKMKFLNALRRAMQRERERKPVILVGDLNITHTALDKYWLDRQIHVQDIMEQVAAIGEGSLANWKRDLVQWWPKIVSALDTKEVVARQTTNSTTGEKFDKFRLVVTVDDKRIFLGKHEAHEGHCLYYYDFGSYTYIDEETNEEHEACDPSVVSIAILAELMEKIGGVKWDDETLRAIAESDDAGVARLHPPRQWLTAILEEDHMVDTFRHFYPTAQGRFTIWNQYTNRRYSNEGSRIDYILVDKNLLEYVQRGAGLRSCGSRHAPLTEAAAHDAATAHGGFRPVSFGGEGIQEVPQRVLDTQFGPAHTGIVYTPPTFSDHVGVSLLVDDSLSTSSLVLIEQALSTRKAQPHRSQTSIASFFFAKTASLGGSKTAVSTKRTKSDGSPDNPKKKKAIKSFFVPRPQRGVSSSRNVLESNSTKAPSMQNKPFV